MHHQPYILHHKPGTLKPHILNPKTQTQPHTSNPKPQKLNQTKLARVPASLEIAPHTSPHRSPHLYRGTSLIRKRQPP